MRGERHLALGSGVHQPFHREGPARHTNRLTIVISHVHEIFWPFFREALRDIPCRLRRPLFHSTRPHGLRVTRAHLHALPENHCTIRRDERSGRVWAAQNEPVENWRATIRDKQRSFGVPAPAARPNDVSSMPSGTSTPLRPARRGRRR